MELFNLTPVFEQRILPKKLAKTYDEYVIRVSFGEEFKNNGNQNLSDEKHYFTSPCWIEMNLNRILSDI